MSADFNSDVNFDNSSLANTLNTELTDGLSSADIPVPTWKPLPDIPDGDIQSVKLPDNLAPSIKDVTAGLGTLTGVGTFDIIMQAMRAQLVKLKDEQSLDTAAIASIISSNITPILEQSCNFALQASQIAVSSAIQAQEAQASYWKAISSREQAYQSQADAYNSRIGAQVAIAQLKQGLSEVALTKCKILEANGQYNLLKLQTETALTQISDTLSDNKPVAGTIGLENQIKQQQIKNMEEQIKVSEEQIKLYEAQRAAYDLDGKIKVTSIWSSNYQTLIANGTLDKVPDVLQLDKTNDMFSKLSRAAGMENSAGIDGNNALG